MRRIVRGIVAALVLLCGWPDRVVAQVQGDLDARSVYLWAGGAARTNVSSGSGAPSGGSTGDLYIDYATGEVYTKLSGGWERVPRLSTVNTFSASQTFNAGWTGTTGSLSSTLHVGGNFDVATNKFTVAAASGDTLAAGTLDVTGNFAVNTNKFTVTASNGNTAVAGTLGVTGNATFSASVGIGTSPSNLLHISGTTGDLVNWVGTNSAAYVFNIDSAGRATQSVTGQQGGGSNGGAYYLANGYEEAFFETRARSSTSGSRNLRFGSKTDAFRLQLLNDASSAVVSTPVIIGATAPDNSFYITTAGDVVFGNTTSGSQHVRIYDNSNSERGLLIENATSGTNAAALLRLTTASETSALVRFSGGNLSHANKLVLVQPGNFPIEFWTTDTQRMAISGAGAVTIAQTLGVTGATTLSSTLGVTGATDFSSTATLTRALAANTSGDGYILTNTTAATSGNQRYSPRVRWNGQGWKTDATAASEAVDAFVELRPVQGAAHPTGLLAVAGAINGGSYADLLSLAFTDGVSTTVTVNNPTAGTANFSRLALANDLGSRGFFTVLSSTFTSSGINLADGLTIASGGANGMTLSASDATGGNIRFYAGGTAAADLAATITVDSRLGIGTTAPDTGLHVKGVFPIGFATIERTGVNGAGAASALSINTDGKTAGDAIQQIWRGLDSGNAAQTYGTMNISIVSPTAAAESSNFRIFGLSGGAANTGLVIHHGDNVGISVAETSFPGTGTKSLVLTDGTAPSSLASNTAALYADDVSGTVALWVIDEAGLTSRLTGAASFPTSVTTPSVYPTAAHITVGSGTGITVNSTGEVRRTVYKVTIARTAFVCAAVTCDVTLATLPAKSRLVGIVADLTQQFACTATCTSSTLSMTVGSAAGGTQYLASFDADAAVARFGLLDADLGTALVRAAAVQGGDLPNWTGTTAVSLRLTSGTGNIGTGAATNLSTGSVTFYLTVEVYQ